jgi:hypothetical protein
MTFEEARAAKRVIEICKLPASDVKAFCLENGASEHDVRNVESRREFVRRTLLRLE